MPTVTCQTIWDNHPYPAFPCSQTHFANQCAIRMGVALENSGIDTSSFDRLYPNRRCYKNLGHQPKHILAAQELANWIAANPTQFGSATKHRNVTSSDFHHKKGIVFIQNGWGPTDHIDIWNGFAMKGGAPEYFSRGQEVWFWELR